MTPPLYTYDYSFIFMNFSPLQIELLHHYRGADVNCNTSGVDPIGSLAAISWTFPVRGYPEIRVQGRHVVEVKVKSRQRHEQRLEVLYLKGFVFEGII